MLFSYSVDGPTNIVMRSVDCSQTSNIVLLQCFHEQSSDCEGFHNIKVECSMNMKCTEVL